MLSSLITHTLFPFLFLSYILVLYVLFIYELATLALARYTSYFCFSLEDTHNLKTLIRNIRIFILHWKVPTILKPPLRFRRQNSFETHIYEVLLWVFTVNKAVVVAAKMCFY
jgi:hypothetical protein